MDSHTPGPWRCEKRIDHHDILDAVGDRVAVTSYVVPHDREAIATDAADARLIAAAPDLLAALRAILDAFDANDSHGIREEIESSRAVISKAEGKA